jgi:hypothetical protein
MDSSRSGVTIMPNKSSAMKDVASWYPSAREIVQTQRAQLEKSKQAQAAFASETFSHASRPWWMRLFGKWLS